MRTWGWTVAGTLLLATPALAQRSGERAPLAACDGTVTTIRTSTVRPGGWREFQRAVAAHAAWYAAHGAPARVTLARVFDRAGYSEREAVTVTSWRDASRQVTHDAAWDRFVALYKASSTIKNEVRVCLPRS